jgi:hypothetical protein
MIRMTKSKRMRWAGHVARMGRKGMPQWKRPLGRRRHGWIILKWILGWGDMDWIDMAQGRDQLRTLVNTVMNLRVT